MSKRYCAAYPCNNLVESGRAYCPDHQPAKPTKDSDPRYSTARWQRYRAWYMARHALCENCLQHGITKAADMVHHIISIRSGGDMYNESNTESLCNPCHAIKTAAERKKRGPVVYSY